MNELKKKQLKLLYYAHDGTDLQEINLGWKKILTLVVACMSLLLLLVSFVLGFFSHLSQNWQAMSLARAHQKLSAVISDMNNRMNNIQGLIEHIEKQDSSLNLFVDAPTKSASLVSTHFASSMLSPSSPASLEQETLQIQKLVDDVAARIDKAAADRSQIKDDLLAKLQQLQQTPSIRPLQNGRISDKFGFRMDPLVGRVMFHEGIDFSAPRGTTVLCSADGVVKEVVTRYRAGTDYGRYVLVDHGYGRQTRYAHLEEINVRVGQKVTRRTVIGSVGDSGRSTGPHLHYEVLENGKTVDPIAFILN
jgi:murein DD-endopeptidase MepM/ murein hydrolase activator NlpD